MPALRWVLCGLVVAACLVLGTAARAVQRFAWSQPVRVADQAPFSAYQSFTGVSCVSANWCAAVASGGRILVSTTAAAGQPVWRVTRVRRSQRFGTPPEVQAVGELQGIACPSTTLCVAVDTAGDVIDSRNPAAVRPRWTTRTIDFGRGLNGIACPTTSLCAAVDTAGFVLTTRRPDGPATGWRARLVDHGTSAPFFSPELDAISCPSTKLCVALDRLGNIAASSNTGAARPTWRFTRLASYGELSIGPGRISCPSLSLCVTVSGLTIASSRDPTRGADAWHAIRLPFSPNVLPQGLTDVSCPSESLCVAADMTGEVLTSQHPGEAAATWTPTLIDRGNVAINGIACPTAHSCVAVDSVGNVLTAVDPVGGASAWRLHDLRQGYNSVRKIVCPAASLCVAIDSSGHLIVSRRPAAQRSAWHVRRLGSAIVTTIACASPTFCYGRDVAGDVVTSTNPAGGPGAWTVTTLPGGADAAGISCPSATLCVAVALNGDAFMSTNPTGGTGTWSVAHADTAVGWECGKYGPGQDCDPGLTSVSCPVRSFCAAGDQNGNVITSTDPAGSGTWKLTSVDANAPMFSNIICPSSRVCVAYSDSSSTLVVSGNPTGGSAAWTPVASATDLGGFDCSDATLCVAYDASGDVFASRQPERPASWKRATVETDRGITATCSRARVCIAFDGFGNVFTSANPTARRPAWALRRVDPVAVTTAVCPSQSLCVAGDAEGNILIGTPRRH